MSFGPLTKSHPNIEPPFCSGPRCYRNIKAIDAVITEVTYSTDDYYQGIITIQAFDALMAKHGFVRVDTVSVRHQFEGDVLYVRPCYTTVPKAS